MNLKPRCELSFVVVEIKIFWWVQTYIQLKYFADAPLISQVTVSSHTGILQPTSAWFLTQFVSQYMNISPHKWPKLLRIEIAGFLNRTRRIFMCLNTDGSYPLHQRPTLRDIEWDLSIMNKPILSATGPCTKKHWNDSNDLLLRRTSSKMAKICHI